MLQPEDIANLATACTLIGTSILMLSLSAIKSAPAQFVKGIRSMQIASILIGFFLLAHGLYHLSEFLGNDFWSDDVLEPLSIVLLLYFSLYVKSTLYVPRRGSNSSRRSTAPILNSSPQSAPRESLAQTRGGRTLSNLDLAIILLALFFIFLFLVLGISLETFTLGGILFSASVFVWMAVRNPSVHTLFFGYAVITVVWSIAEIPHILSSLGVVAISAGVDQFGTWVHFASMLFIGVFVSYRAIKVTLISERGPDAIVPTATSPNA